MVEIVEVGGPALERHVANALSRSAQAGQCLTERSADSGVTDVAKYEAMAAQLGGASGLLEDRRSFLGPLVSAAEAFRARQLFQTSPSPSRAWIIRIARAEERPISAADGDLIAVALTSVRLNDGRTVWAQLGDHKALTPCE